MTASHALSQLSYTPIGGVILSDFSEKSKPFFKKTEKAFLLGIHRRFQKLKDAGVGGEERIERGAGVVCADEQVRGLRGGGIGGTGLRG